MDTKKNPGRFCIQLDINDPRHYTVIKVLEEQGRKKGKYIVESILHFINCSESPETPPDSMTLKEKVEALVIDYLNKNGLKLDSTANIQSKMQTSEKIEIEEVNTKGIEEIDDKLSILIQDSLRAFKN